MEPPGHNEKAKAWEHLMGEGVQQEALAAGLLGVHEPRVEGPRAAGVAGEHKQGRQRGHAAAARGGASTRTAPCAVDARQGRKLSMMTGCFSYRKKHQCTCVSLH